MPNVYIAYSGQNPGNGAWAAVWQSQHGIYDHLTDVVSDTTANAALIEAAYAVLQHFPKTAVTICSSLTYIANSASRLKTIAAEGWQKNDGTPIDNLDLWQRVYQTRGFQTARWAHRPDSHGMIRKAKALAAQRRDEHLAGQKAPA